MSLPGSSGAGDVTELALPLELVVLDGSEVEERDPEVVGEDLDVIVEGSDVGLEDTKVVVERSEVVVKDLDVSADDLDTVVEDTEVTVVIFPSTDASC